MLIFLYINLGHRDDILTTGGVPVFVRTWRSVHPIAVSRDFSPPLCLGLLYVHMNTPVPIFLGVLLFLVKKFYLAWRFFPSFGLLSGCVCTP